MRYSFALIFAACLTVSGCRDHRHRDEPFRGKVDDAQRAQLDDAVSHLRGEFNAGTCELVYDEASAHVRSQDPKEWRRECALLKQELGSWRSFQVKVEQKWSEQEPIVCVIGNAAFEKYVQQIGMVWTLGNKGAKLFSLFVRENLDREWMEIPSRPSLIRHPWIEPPAAESLKNNVAL
jgi:hypothetical protein